MKTSILKLMLVATLAQTALAPCAATGGSYDASYSPGATPTLRPGQTVTVTVAVKNTGTQTWIPTGPNPFRLSYHWYPTGAVPTGTVPGAPAPNYGAVIFDGLRTNLPQPVAPGMTVPLAAQVQAPSATGQYILKWDLVQEGVTWFSRQGVPTKDQTVTVQSPAAASPPVGTIALACKLVDCTPKVTGVVPLISRIEPGGLVVVTGINFSTRPGKIRLIGALPAGWVGAFPGRILELEVNDWGDTFAYGTIPDVTRVFDQEVTVQVVTSGGLAANAPSKSKFKARQDLLALPGAGLRVFSCAPGRYVNDYAYCIGYHDSTHFFGYHRTDHKVLNPGDNGIDVLETKVLRNGWVFDYMDLIETQKDDGRVDRVDGFRSNSDRATLNIAWSTGRQGSIYYLTRLYIKGPAGIPFID